jgi:hypothetical protein
MQPMPSLGLPHNDGLNLTNTANLLLPVEFLCNDVRRACNGTRLLAAFAS